MSKIRNTGISSLYLRRRSRKIKKLSQFWQAINVDEEALNGDTEALNGEDNVLKSDGEALKAMRGV